MSSLLLPIQTFLLDASLEDLERVHHVLGKPGSYKFSLNYDQILSEDSNALAMQCRGLVLARKDGATLKDVHEKVGETVILAYPFRRFFNLGQSCAASVDFHHPETRFFNKEDGTLIIVYFDPYKGEWCVATRSVCEANLPIDGRPDLTFRSLFEQTIEKVAKISFVEWSKLLQKDWTYCFELTTPLNQVVVRHSDFGLHLLMVRNVKTCAEAPQAMLEGISNVIGIPLPVSYQFSSVDEMQRFVDSRKGAEFEGIVVCDRDHNRVKVKSQDYLTAARISTKMGATPRNMLSAILAGQADDIYPILPEYHQKALGVLQEQLRLVDEHHNATYKDILSHVDGIHGTPEHRKAFAMQINQRKELMGFFMAMYRKGPEAEFLSSIVSGDEETFPNSFLDSLLGCMSKHKGSVE